MSTIIAVLGGSIYQDSNGCWHTTDNAALYGSHGIRFGRWRVEAAAILYRGRRYQQSDDATTIVAHGGGGTDTQPSIASVIERELMALGVPSNVIVRDDDSPSTYAELLALQTLVVNIQQPHSKVWIVSNEWHLDRVQAILEFQPELGALQKCAPQLIACEQTLLGHEPERWTSIIADSRRHPTYDRLLRQEARGIEALKNGTYNLRVA